MMEIYCHLLLQDSQLAEDYMNISLATVAYTGVHGTVVRRE